MELFSSSTGLLPVAYIAVGIGLGMLSVVLVGAVGIIALLIASVVFAGRLSLPRQGACLALFVAPPLLIIGGVAAFGAQGIGTYLFILLAMFMSAAGWPVLIWTIATRDRDEWQLHIPSEDNRLLTYRCGLVAGQRVALRKDLVIRDHQGNPTGEVHQAGEVWVVLPGMQSDPVLWLRQEDGRRHTWDDDRESVQEWFELRDSPAEDPSE